jgi:hypothetical protein
MIKLTRGLISLTVCAIASWAGGPAAAQSPGGLGAPFGVFLSVANYPSSSPDDLRKALNDVTPLTGAITLMWDWRDRYNDFQYISDTVPLVRVLGKRVFLQFNPAALGKPSPPFGLAPTFTNPAVQALFLSDVRRLAALKPDYLNLGAEINILCLYSLQEYLTFAQLYRQAYAWVKQISPLTKVGVSYHNDVIFMYGQNNPQFINLMGPQDYVGFTVYPAWTVYSGIFKSIDLIPTSYFTRIRDLVPDRPIVLAELGWPSGGRSSLLDQARFMSLLPNFLAGVQPEQICWALLNDLAYFTNSSVPPELDPTVLTQELNSMGLFSQARTPKPGFFVALQIIGAQPAASSRAAPAPGR